MVSILGSLGVAQGRQISTCPLSAAVYPFPAFDLRSFEIAVTDGAVGDLDGEENGRCTIYLQLCVGDPPANERHGLSGAGCPSQGIESLTVRLRWGDGPEHRQRVIADLYRSMLAVLPGTEADPRKLYLSRASAQPRGCGTVVIPISIDGIRRTQKTQLRVLAALPDESGFPRTRRLRMLLRCLPATSSSDEPAPTCRSRGENCLDAVPEPPFEPPPVTTTTTFATSTTTRFTLVTTSTTRPVPTTTSTTRPAFTTTSTVRPGSTTTLFPGQTTTTTASPTTTTFPSSSSGRTFYLSPSGSDTNNGMSSDRPWRTFGRLFNRTSPLRPGDTIVLLDGVYTRTTTGLPRINCGPGGNAPNGTSRAPITIRAANERRAFLASDGWHPGFEMTRCSYWSVIGLRAANADNLNDDQATAFPFRFNRVSYVTAKRLLASHPNRFHNAHALAVEDSHDVTLEECEAYYFHRHAFSIWRSRYVTLRRCYANSMRSTRQGAFSAIDNRDWGDEAVSLYGTSDSIVENCISENKANGFQIHGIANVLDPSGSGGRRNRIVGSISLDDAVPLLIGSRGGDGNYHNARENTVENFVALRSDGNGVYVRGARGTVVRNVTTYGSSIGSGITADDGDPGMGGTCNAFRACATSRTPCSTSRECGGGPCVANPAGCSVTVEHSLSFQNSGYGVLVTKNHDWLVNRANSVANGINYPSDEPIADSAGNIRRSLAVMPTRMGLQPDTCILWVPDGSNMKGAGVSGSNIGATILYRYKNGQLTSERLWDRATGAFPCGAAVPGVNDGPLRCTNVHERLNVNRNGCMFPSRY